MQLARVIGRVVATRSVEGLEGLPFQWVQPLDEDGRDEGAPLVAATVVSSGPGDLVHFVDGREAALAAPVPFVPLDATILGFVEELAKAAELEPTFPPRPPRPARPAPGEEA